MKRALRHPLLWIMLLASALVAALIADSGPVEAYDTVTYYQATDRIAVCGYDTMRTHFYPVCIWLTFRLCGYAWQAWGLVLLQAAAFLLSIPALWAVARGMLGGRWLPAVVTALYALLPGGPAGFVPLLLTESLTVSAMVFVLYFAWRALAGSRSPLLAAGLLAALAALLSLRPAMVAVAPAGVALLCALFVRRAPLRWWALAASALAAVPLAFQVAMVWRATGVLTSSEVSVINKYLMLRDGGVRLAPYAESPQMSEALEDMLAHPRLNYFEEYLELRPVYGVDGVNRLCSRAGAPWWGLGDRLLRSATDYALLMDDNSLALPWHLSSVLGRATLTAWIPYWVVYAVALLAAAAIAAVWARPRRAPWWPMVLWLTLVAVAATSVVYGPNHFDRLTLPAIPALLLLAAWLPQAVREAIRPREHEG